MRKGNNIRDSVLRIEQQNSLERQSFRKRREEMLKEGTQDNFLEFKDSDFQIWKDLLSF